MPDLTVRAIGVEGLMQVYPLIRSATRVSLARWEEFGRQLLGTGGGVLAIVAPDECIHGVAAYRPGMSLRHELTLDVEVIVAFELRGDDRVREALCRHLDRIALEGGFATINFTVAAKNAEPDSHGRCVLEQLGLKLETAGFVRELPR